MVPKLHAKGSSFKGAAAYLLHDKDRALTNDRVAWTEVRNLATDSPHVAWKVMAATAMNQDRLKAEAGVKKTGRKSMDAVLHFTLSWHPDEKDGLTREEMTRAATQAIRALDASDRQAMIVCHDDEPQPHIHILLNRVSTKDGRMLSSSKEKLALSKWAQAYEKERGFIYCDMRVINNEARDRGEYTRGVKGKARNIFEAEAANDNAQAVRTQQRRKDAEVEKRARSERERHRRAWEGLQQAHQARVKDIKTRARFDAEARQVSVRSKYKDRWTMLHHEHQAQERDFERRERTILGRVRNIRGAIDLKAIISGGAEAKEIRGRGQVISEAFQAFSDAGVRLEALKRQQRAAGRDLQRRQKFEEKDAIRKVVAMRDEALKKNRTVFDKQRNDLILTQSLEGAKLRADRMVRNQHRAKGREDYQTRKPMPGPSVPREESIVTEKQVEVDHVPDRFFERADSIKRRFESSAEDRFERKPSKDRDRD